MQRIGIMKDGMIRTILIFCKSAFYRDSSHIVETQDGEWKDRNILASIIHHMLHSALLSFLLSRLQFLPSTSPLSLSASTRPWWVYTLREDQCLVLRVGGSTVLRLPMHPLRPYLDLEVCGIGALVLVNASVSVSVTVNASLLERWSISASHR